MGWGDWRLVGAAISTSSVSGNVSPMRHDAALPDTRRIVPIAAASTVIITTTITSTTSTTGAPPIVFFFRARNHDTSHEFLGGSVPLQFTTSGIPPPPSLHASLPSQPETSNPLFPFVVVVVVTRLDSINQARPHPRPRPFGHPTFSADTRLSPTPRPLAPPPPPPPPPSLPPHPLSPSGRPHTHNPILPQSN